MRQWVEQTDPALLTGTQAAGDVERLATVIRQLTAAQTGLAGRAAECNSYSRRSPSPEDWLARQNGTSRSEAKRAIDTARRLKDCPAAAEAFDRGELSLGEAEAISGAARARSVAEDRLVSRRVVARPGRDPRAGRAGEARRPQRRRPDRPSALDCGDAGVGPSSTTTR